MTRHTMDVEKQPSATNAWFTMLLAISYENGQSRTASLADRSNSKTKVMKEWKERKKGLEEKSRCMVFVHGPGWLLTWARGSHQCPMTMSSSW